MPVPGAEQEETRPTRRPWLTLHLDRTEGKLNGKQIAPSLGLYKAPHVLVNLFDWQIGSSRWFRAVWDHDSEWVVLSAIHVLIRCISLYTHHLLLPLFSPASVSALKGL